MYMTPAQLSAATRANGTGAAGMGRRFAAGEVSDGSGWSGCVGYRGGDGVVVYSRGTREYIVLDMT